MKLLDSIEQEYIYKHGSAQIPYLIRVAKAAREVTYQWSEEAMEKLAALLEEEA